MYMLYHDGLWLPGSTIRDAESPRGLIRALRGEFKDGVSRHDRKRAYRAALAYCQKLGWFE